jgi:integrase
VVPGSAAPRLMGRKRSVNSHLPPRMRKRVRHAKAYYYYDAGGKPRREIPLGSDYVTAVQRWAELEMEGRERVVQLVTFRVAAERYCLKILPRKAARTQRDNLVELAKLYEFFDAPPAPLDELTPRNIRQYLDWRTNNGTKATTRANRERALFSHIWNFAREEGLTEKPNPCAGVHGYREAGRDIYIEDEVYTAIYKAACRPIQDAMDLAYLTGQRPADTLRISQAHVRGDVLEIRPGKTQGSTGTKIRLRLVDAAGQPNALGKLVARLKSQAEAHPVHSLQMIQNEKGQALSHQALIKRFRKARTEAAKAAKGAALRREILAVQFRDLRAKAGTDKAEAADPRRAQQQLGHASVVMTEKYIRGRKGDLSDPTK